MKFYKVTNESECHHGFQYRDGLNVDILPFESDSSKSCCPGGLYFTDANNILFFTQWGVWIREVTIPDGAKIVRDGANKWRADKIFLGARRRFGSLSEMPDMSLYPTFAWDLSYDDFRMHFCNWLSSNDDRCFWIWYLQTLGIQPSKAVRIKWNAVMKELTQKIRS